MWQRAWTDIGDDELRRIATAVNDYSGNAIHARKELMRRTAARGMSAGTAEIAQQTQAEGRQPGPKDAP